MGRNLKIVGIFRYFEAKSLDFTANQRIFWYSQNQINNTERNTQGKRKRNIKRKRNTKRKRNAKREREHKEKENGRIDEITLGSRCVMHLCV